MGLEVLRVGFVNTFNAQGNYHNNTSSLERVFDYSSLQVTAVSKGSGRLLPEPSHQLSIAVALSQEGRQLDL